MLSHGTLLFDSDLQALTKSLDSTLEVVKSKGIQSIKSEVTNVAEYLPHPMDMAIFRKKRIESLSDVFGKLKSYQLTGDDWDRIYQLCESKYKSWNWAVRISQSGSGNFSSVKNTPIADRMVNTNTRHTQFITISEVSIPWPCPNTGDNTV